MDLDKSERLSSTVIVQRVRVGCEGAYREWSRKINTACSEFPGFADLEVFEPAAGEKDFVIVVRFASAEEGDRWHSSSICKRLLEEAEPYLEQRVVHSPSSVYGSWFRKAEAASSESFPSPPWKEALVVLLALYPTVMLLTLFVIEPFFKGWSMATAMYVGNMMSVALLTWVLMPKMTRWLSFWLRPTARTGSKAAAGGLAVVLGGQWIAVVLFHYLLAR